MDVGVGVGASSFVCLLLSRTVRTAVCVVRSAFCGTESLQDVDGAVSCRRAGSAASGGEGRCR